jgi:hypothetical protein
MRNASMRAVVLGVASGLACSDSTPPPEAAELGPPVILASSITLDSTAQVGHFRVVASDPDGPVHLSCGGAFPGQGVDSVALVRPFAELRFADEFLTTTCQATEGDSTVLAFAAVEYEYAIDRLPGVDLPLPHPTPHVGEPSVWHLQVSDDWAVAEYWFGIGPGVDPDCTLQWTRVGTWPGTDQTAIDTTVTATFATTGPHCVVLGARDDLGRNVGTLMVVEVAP